MILGTWVISLLHCVCSSSCFCRVSCLHNCGKYITTQEFKNLLGEVLAPIRISMDEMKSSIAVVNSK